MVLAPVRRRSLLLALALPFVFAASASAQPRSSIVGRVTDSATGRPVAAGSLSHVFQGYSVVDTVSGQVYRNQGFGGFSPWLSTDGFRTCGSVPLAGESGYGAPAAASGRGVAAAVAATAGHAAGGAAAAASSPGPCVPSAERLCLAGGRFAVEAEWEAGAAGSGPAQAVPVNDKFGTFWFFRAAQPELVVKILDACRLPEPQGFWVFATGLTNLGVTLRVTDLASGLSREYVNPRGEPFTPVQDTRTFADVCIP